MEEFCNNTSYENARVNNPLDSRFDNYIIDTSIAGNDNIIANISDLCAKGKKIFVTTTTVDELTKLVGNRDLETSAAARKILRLSSVTNPDSFTIVDTSEYSGMSAHINEALGICDSRILQFCYENRSNTLLLTADRAMSLYARSLQIPVKCLDTRITFINKGTYLSNRPKGSFLQLENNPDYPAMHVARQNGSLIIHQTQNPGAGIAIRVISPNGKEMNYGPIYLYVGYIIMIARIDQRNDIHFSVYRVTDVATPTKGKYELVFSKFYKSFYTYFNVDGNESYGRFLTEFKEKYRG